MKVLITGTTRGIGKETALLFLEKGHEVIGIDRDLASITHTAYTHYILDIRDKEAYPSLEPVDILVNNAGVQNEDDININLKSLINITERYGIHEKIKSIVNIGSASAHTGAEFAEYAASKGGVLAYTKNVALRIAKYGATCNSLDFGGILTELNTCVIEDPDLWNQIMDQTPLKRWATPREAAIWIYFIAVHNKFCTGENILIDGLEAGNSKFIYPGYEY